MNLSTDKIYIRPILKEDTDMVLGWRNSELVKQYFIYREDITVDEHINWLETKVKTGKVCQFVICVKETDKPIGSVYLQNIDMFHKNAEYGIFIGEVDSLGKGYGSDAAKLALDYAFDVLKLHKVYLRVLNNNDRAIKSYEKVGFKIEGVLKDEVFVDGAYCDVVRMAVVKEDK